MGFYGKHTLQLEPGVNFVVGPGMSGKTTLVMALRFAIAGRTACPFCAPLNCLINRKHREESSNPSCRVEVEIQSGESKWHATGSVSLVGERVLQSSELYLGLDETAISARLNRMIIDDETGLRRAMAYLDKCSTGTRIEHMIRRWLDQNLEEGITMAIIDGPWERLDLIHRNELMEVVTKLLPMEQVTIMVKSFPGDIEDWQCTIHQIEYDLENDS